MSRLYINIGIRKVTGGPKERYLCRAFCDMNLFCKYSLLSLCYVSYNQLLNNSAVWFFQLWIKSSFLNSIFKPFAKVIQNQKKITFCSISFCFVILYNLMKTIQT